MKKHLLLYILLCFFSVAQSNAQRVLSLGEDQQYTVGSGSSFDTRVDRINDTHFITIWKEGISSSTDVYARIGEVNPIDKTVSYGAAYLIEDASANFPDVVVLSETKAVVFLELDTSNDRGEAKVINFDLTSDNITSEGSYTAFSAGDIRPSSFGGIDAHKISETQFVVSYLDQDSSEKGIVKIGTATGNSLSFGEENVFAVADVQYQSLDLVDASTIIVAWEDNGTSNDPGVARVGTISGTAISWGEIYTFHASSGNANRFNAVTSLDNDKFVIAFMNDADGDSGAAVVGTRAGDVLSFGSLQTFDDTQVCRDITIDKIGENEFALGFNGGSGSNSAMYVGKLNGDNIDFGDRIEALDNLADESRVLALNNNTIVFAFVNESTLFDIGDVKVGTLPAACIEPDVPTLSVSNELVTAGVAIDLNISGSLEDATQWHVYTTACGVTELASSATSPISVTPGTGSTTYYVRAEGDCTSAGSCGTITVYTEGGITTTYTSGAWDNGTPNAAYHAIINDNLTATNDFNAYSLTINEGKAFDLNGNELSITTDVTLESGASLLDDGLSSIGGTQTVKRLMNAEALTDFHLMSAPISNGNYETSFQGSYVYRYVGDEYDNIYTFENGATIVPGEGAAISGNGNATTRTYTGNLNKGNIGYTLISTDQWHLLGNPYPAPLSLDAFQAANNTSIGTTFYFYNEASGAYNTWNTSLDNGTGNATAFAGVTQGFFAEELNSSATQVSYTGAMRTIATNTFLKTPQEDNTAIVKLRLNDTETLIAWDQSSSDAKDINDASYLQGSANSDIYSLLFEKPYTIQTIDADFNSKTIPLGYYTLTNGINTISLSDFIVDENIEIVLVDKYQNTIHHLQTNAYEFTASASELKIEDRFEIILTKNTLSTNEYETPQHKLIVSGGRILNVISENTLKEIRIYDITGVLVHEENNIDLKHFNWKPKLANAVYIIEVTTEDITSYHKIILE